MGYIHKISSEYTTDNIVVAINCTQPIPKKRRLGPKCLQKYGHKPIIYHQIELINQCFVKPSIVVISGCFPKQINSITGVTIIENQLFESTRQAEDFRLVAQTTKAPKIIFMPDDMILSKEDLLSLSERSSIITSSRKLSEKTPIINNGIFQDMMFFKEEMDLYYGNIFCLTGKELNIALDFCFENIYGPYLDIEMLSHVANSGGSIYECYSDTARILL